MDDTDNMVEMSKTDKMKSWMRYTKWRTQPTIDQEASISNPKPRKPSISTHDTSHTEHGEEVAPVLTRKDLRDPVLAIPHNLSLLKYPLPSTSSSTTPFSSSTDSTYRLVSRRPPAFPNPTYSLSSP